MVINVKSEIGPLKKVLLHRPGAELLNLTPDTLEELLFDDIPYLKIALEEHDEFARVLAENGAQVIYLEDLVAETLKDESIRDLFLKQFIHEVGIYSEKYQKLLYEFLNQIKDPKELVLKTMQGVKRDELTCRSKGHKSLVEYMEKQSSFICDPMPNLYFTRDAFACIGNGVSINRMHYLTRRRETIYGEYIFKYHPKFKDKVDIYYNRYEPFYIEGGDILNLSSEILAIGISQRTKAEAIEILAKNIFGNKNTSINQILAFDIPNNRAMMHLDTVFTQIDYDKFTYHPGIVETLQVFEITEGDIPDSDEDLNVREIKGSLEEILEHYLDRKITLIPCAGGEKTSSEREQWNDGTNTLCISPGVVVVYNRNNITNNILREHGIKVIEMSSAELSRGRGGPRCMSMPIIREDLR